MAWAAEDPNKLPEEAFPPPVPGRCNARKNRNRWADPDTPERCMAYPVPGRERCKFHGGAVPRGLDSTRYKGKGFTKDLPLRLAERLNEVLDDPDMLSLERHIGLIDIRIGEVFEKLPTKESAEAWIDVANDVNNAMGELRKLRERVEKGEGEDIIKTLDKLGWWLKQAQAAFDLVQAERQIWAEFRGLAEDARRLRETETKRETQLEANLTAKQAVTLMGGVYLAIAEVLQGEPEYKRKLAEKLRRIFLNDPTNGRAKLLGQPLHATVEAEDVEITDDSSPEERSS